MKPGVYPIEVKAGTTLALSLAWKDAAGVAVVLTGYSARLVVGYANDGNDVLLDCTTANGKITLGGSPYNIEVSGAVGALKPGAYIYDLMLIDSGARRYSVLTGPFTVLRNKAAL